MLLPFLLVATTQLPYASLHNSSSDCVAQVHYPSVQSLEYSLAAKCELLRVHTSHLEELVQRFSTFADLLRSRDGQSISEEEGDELFEEAFYGWDPELVRKKLASLANTPLIGQYAKRLIHCNEEELSVEFDQLFGEIRAEIGIAKSMGLDVTKYEAILRDYVFNAIACKIWISQISSPSNTEVER